MEENYLNRWYDKDPKMLEVLDVIETLNDEEQEQLGINLIGLINLLRENRKEDEIPLSIGKNRVLGLYKASNKRRWYDKHPTLMGAMNILCTLPIEDCRKITEGLLLTLNGEVEEEYEELY